MARLKAQAALESNMRLTDTRATRKLEVTTPIETEAVKALKSLPGVECLKAFKLQFRHPRYQNKLTEPQFFVSFRMDGHVQAEGADSAEELDREIWAHFGHCLPATQH
jgi:hypothetical protein